MLHYRPNYAAFYFTKERSKMLKKILLLICMIFSLFSCYKEEFKIENPINLITREQGSGTRGAFMEIFKLEKKGKNFKKDLISKEAGVENNTNTIIQTVKNDKHAIGYISLGSINDEIKVLDIQGVSPTLENVQIGKYEITRDFNIAIKDNVSDLAKDFLEYILSNEGQEIVKQNGYIPIKSEKKYFKKKVIGKIVIGGSSSVSPLMEKLIEEYLKINTNAKIELQISDSTVGVQKAIEDVYDIGLASRNLKEKEKEYLKQIPIAIDAIVLIVNKDNILNNLNKDQIRKMYLGEITRWEELIK